LFVEQDRFYNSGIAYFIQHFFAQHFANSNEFYNSSIFGGFYPRTIVVADTTRTVATSENTRVVASYDVADVPARTVTASGATRIVASIDKGRVVETQPGSQQAPTRTVAVSDTTRAVVAVSKKDRVVESEPVSGTDRTIDATSKGRVVTANNGKTRKVAA